MYNIDNIPKDFPWTTVSYNEIEPWRKKGSNWFDKIPEGWGNLCYMYLSRLAHLLDICEKYNVKEHLVIEQVKEKFGSLRFYYTFLPWKENEIEPPRWFFESFDDIVNNFEDMTAYVCCDCGAVENLKTYGWWVHVACPECERKRQEKEQKEYKEAQKRYEEWQKENN